MKTLKEYADLVNREIAALKVLNGEPDGLYAPIRYAMEGGGKRLRPVLTLAVAQASGMSADKAMMPALGMEIYHNFTLLHDDIMDKSPIRHGRPSVFKKWDEATAILSGDAMLTIAGQLVLSTDFDSDRKVRMIELFNRVAMDVYRGQQLDMDFETRDDVNEQEYIEMIRLKTSALLSGSCEMGAVAAGCGEESVRLFAGYGDYVGQAFQLQDDLLDSFGDTTTFGKPIGGDILNDKKTWLNIVARKEASEAMAKATALTGQDKIDAVKEIYTSLSLPERCSEMIERLTRDAIDSVRKLGLKAEDEAFFVDFANKLVGRKS